MTHTQSGLAAAGNELLHGMGRRQCVPPHAIEPHHLPAMRGSTTPSRDRLEGFSVRAALRLLPACLLLLVLAACTPATSATPGETERAPTPNPSRPAGPTPQANLEPFIVDVSRPFSQVEARSWSPEPYAGPALDLPVKLSTVANPEVLDGLTSAQRAFLAENGFVVIHSQEPQFNDIRYRTAYALGQPFFRTTDEAYHALHLLFDDLLKALELQVFRPQVIGLLTATRDQVRSYAAEATGTSIESDVELAEAYLDVALQLFDPSSPASQVLPERVATQVQQIMDAGGRDLSALFPDFEDDYGAYKPVGHYAGDPDLEAYFRGMTWLGRVHFPLAKADDPTFEPSRLPLIITLAIRQSTVNGHPAHEVWGDVHRLLDFLIGPTDDLGPPEYAALMDTVYGVDVDGPDLADHGKWETFQASASDLPAPQINSTFVDFTADLEIEKGWRFMGQRFTMDANIFQSLIFDRVEPRADGQRREFPTGLDVMGVFGSRAAMEELDRRGETTYPNYAENLSELRDSAEAQPEAEWLARAYSAWLYSFLPVLASKDGDYPPFMRTDAWGFKDLNAALGSWAELKHDTVLYSKMPEGAGGGGPPMSGPAPSYVEPNPDAFHRMAYVARAIGQGLEERISPESLAVPPSDMADPTAYWLISEFVTLAGHLDQLGEIAALELAGQEIGDEARYAATRCLGFHECTYTDTGYNRPQGEMPDVPIVAAVSGSQDSVLEAATGYVDRIYVIVPLEGTLEVAQGGASSYYEFVQPRDVRLTDEEWRSQLSAGQAPPRPAWTQRFSLEGGSPTEALFFRLGDIYIVTEAGDNLNLRQSPSTEAPILGVLDSGSYLTFIEGPVDSGGYTWWKVECTMCSFDEGPTPEPAGSVPPTAVPVRWGVGVEILASSDIGWIVENREWLDRSYAP